MCTSFVLETPLLSFAVSFLTIGLFFCLPIEFNGRQSCWFRNLGDNSLDAVFCFKLYRLRFMRVEVEILFLPVVVVSVGQTDIMPFA